MYMRARKLVDLLGSDANEEDIEFAKKIFQLK